MSKGLQWIIGVGVVLAAAAVVFASVAPYFLATPAWEGDLAGWRTGHMMGLWGMRGGLTWMPFGLGFVVPLLLLGAVALGILLWAGRRREPAMPADQPTAVCIQCRQPLLPAWKACPHCGTRRE